MQISISELKVNPSHSIPNVHWIGKKPNLNRPRPTLRGKSLAETILKMR